MKKIFTWLLVFATFLQSFSPLLVAAETWEGKDFVVPKITSLETGTIELDLKFVLPMYNVSNSNIEIKLENEKGSTSFSLNGITMDGYQTFTIGEKDGYVYFRKMDKTGNLIEGIDQELVRYYAFTFYGLETGEYTFTLTGDGYKTTKVENILLQQYSKRISITNTKGGFTVGDVNEDNQVDENDLKLIVEAIKNKWTDELYDLNRDGKIDTADLSMISHAIYDEEIPIKKENTSAILKRDSFELKGNENTFINGTVEDLLSGSSVLEMHTKDHTPISSDNPVELSLEMKDVIDMSEIRLDVGEENAPSVMNVTIETELGDIEEYQYIAEKEEGGVSSVSPFTDKASLNTITIKLNHQVAVKRVKISILETLNHASLADISKVDFLNNVYEEVPVPKIEVPKNVKVEAKSETATVTFSEMDNVTGYEIVLNKIVNGVPSVEGVYQTTLTTQTFEELKNYTEYSVVVTAINGEWRSAPSEEVAFIPTPNRIPPAVELVVANAVSTGFDISYKKMDDTVSYNVFYREKGVGEFIKISSIKENKFQLRNLKEGTEYEIYITGTNELGEGPKSQTIVAKTITFDFPDTQQYRRINREHGIGVLTDHIKSVAYATNQYNASEFALVDHDLSTFWQADTWDVGGFNTGHGGPKITFDQKYAMNYLDIVPKDDTASFFYAKVAYVNDEGKWVFTPSSISKKTAPNGQIYYRVSFDKIETNQIEINLGNYLATGNIAIRELMFYEYDPVEGKINDLFTDDLHVALRSDVNEELIRSLEDQVNTIEEVSKEYHPSRNTLLQELEYARQILNDPNLQKDIITVDTGVSLNNDSHTGFAYTINDFQPLGIAVKGGEEIVIYVGASNKNHLPTLVFTQYYAEAGKWQTSYANLKVGRNVITVPDIITTSSEHGGSIYVRYPFANASNERVEVRVSGGTKIPMLDLHNVTDKTVKENKVRAYIEELTSYVGNLRKTYSEEQLKTAVLNSTEIVTKDGLLSFAASQVLSGTQAERKTLDEQVNGLTESLEAFDEMMALFYRHKGFVQVDKANPSEEEKANRLPTSRINIRYMRMFDGAFMYAGGFHIGIEYGSIPGLTQGKLATVAGNDVTTYGYFGWGISHEIGHQINEAHLAHAEVTNNVYALLAQTADDKNLARIEELYEKIYEKVTSNTKGKASNVFVTLAMYWQLHLAYDDQATFTDTNSIYARINTLARTTDYKNTYQKDDLLYILASKAANHDLLSYFEAWGLVISEAAQNEITALNLPKETREIRYLNDGARRSRLKGGKGFSASTTVNATVTTEPNSKLFQLNLSVSQESDRLLGYEIKRNGVVVGFTTKDTFVDNVGSMNNRAIQYEVTAYDKLLGKTKTIKLNEMKVEHDGSINKESFTIRSNVKAAGEKIDDENPEMDYDALSVHHLLDGETTIFEGTEKVQASDTDDAYVIIDFNQTLDVSGLKYKRGGKNPITNYQVYVSADRENWVLAKEGTFKNETETIYFDEYGTSGGDQLYTYEDVGYIKIVSVGKQMLSGDEFDIIAPPGDNIEISSIGKLKEAYVYDESLEDGVIPAGSIIVQGTYRGNPAFNTALIADASKNFDVDSNFTTNVYNGTFLAFAKLTDQGKVDEIANGTWLFVIKPEDYEKIKGKEVRAVLFRTDNALTNGGARLTSTSRKITVPTELQDILIEGGE